MSPELATVVTALIAALSAIASGVLAFRAQRRGSQAAEKAAVIEGYDELVTHLQAEVGEAKADARAARAETADLRRQNAEQAKEIRALHAENDEQAEELRGLQAQLGLVREHLGAPAEWDPRIHGVRPYGRRVSDGPILPEGHEWFDTPPTEDPP